MLDSSADTKISNGAPEFIWLASVAEDPYEIFIFTPGCAVTNFFVKTLYWACKLDAANTLTVLGDTALAD